MPVNELSRSDQKYIYLVAGHLALGLGDYWTRASGGRKAYIRFENLEPRIELTDSTLRLASVSVSLDRGFSLTDKLEGLPRVFLHDRKLSADPFFWKLSYGGSKDEFLEGVVEDYASFYRAVVEVLNPREVRFHHNGPADRKPVPDLDLIDRRVGMALKEMGVIVPHN